MTSTIRRPDGSAAIHASFERGMAELERLLGSPDEVPDTMRTIMRTAQTQPGGQATNGAQQRRKQAAGTNADNDMRGSQLQTALDRGDYGTQDEAVGAQAEETRRKADKDTDPRGNQTGSIDYSHNDSRYVLARRLAAINTVEEFAPELAAELRKRAEMVGEPLGGEPPSVAEGREGAEMGAPAATEPPPDVTTGASPDANSNLAEIIRQKAEEVRQAETDLAAKKEVLEGLQSAAQEVTTGPDMSKGAGKRKTAGEMEDALPGHGSRIPGDNFSAKPMKTPKDVSGGDPDDSLAAEARGSNGKSTDGPGHVAERDAQAQRDAGDYPHGKGASRKQGEKVQPTTPKTAAPAVPPPAATAPVAKTAAPAATPVPKAPPARTAVPKTAAGDDDIQPQGHIDAPVTYSGEEEGDRGHLETEIGAGTTPTLESAETERVVGEGNRTLESESRQSMAGSAVASRGAGEGAAKVAVFDDRQRKQLIAEVEAIDGAFDAMGQRIAHARKLMQGQHGEEVARIAGARTAALKRCADAIAAALKKGEVDEATAAKIRTATKEVVRLGRREVIEARREMGYLGAALIEARRSREREARLAPAFALAVQQLQTGLLQTDELPAKVAEYLTMDGPTFKTVARMVEETGARMRRASAGNRRTASRIPNVPEDPMAGRPKDDLDGIFD